MLQRFGCNFIGENTHKKISMEGRGLAIPLLHKSFPYIMQSMALQMKKMGSNFTLISQSYHKANYQMPCFKTKQAFLIHKIFTASHLDFTAFS